jgi:hypothetical protein
MLMTYYWSMAHPATIHDDLRKRISSTKLFTPRDLSMEKSVTFTGACANEIITSINRSFVYKAREIRHVRIVLICKGPLTILILTSSGIILSLLCPKEDVLITCADECDRLFHWQHKMSANVNINYRLPIKAYYRICTLRYFRIEINHGSQNVFWVLTGACANETIPNW